MESKLWQVWVGVCTFIPICFTTFHDIFSVLKFRLSLFNLILGIFQVFFRFLIS